MIAQARSNLVALLEDAGFRAFSEVPERVTPPLAVLVPSADWIESGETFNSFVLSFDVEIVAAAGSNVKISEDIDEQVETALVAITEAPGFYASSVGQPQAVEINGAVYLGATITVRQNFNL